jgi:diketogulonate reductase-like aldo/keto reductase
VMASFESSLGHFNTDYIDSYILHGPKVHGKVFGPEDWEVYRALEALYDAGKVRVIGLSNVNAEQLQQVLDRCRIRPHVLQIRTFGNTGWDDKIGGVRALCDAHGIRYEGYSVLTANRKLLQHATWQSVARARDDTAEQLAFRFSLQLGMVLLTGTTSKSHTALDLNVVHGPQYQAAGPSGGGGGGGGGGSAASFDPLGEAEMSQLLALVHRKASGHHDRRGAGPRQGQGKLPRPPRNSRNRR